jgi:putative transposase
MNWKRMLAGITGSVDPQLLLRNEYLVTENRILRHQFQGRLRLTDSERIGLAQIGKQLGGKVLGEVAQIVRPETILGWHRRLVAQKFDGSKERGAVNPAPIAEEIEKLVLKLAGENRAWGYRRLALLQHGQSAKARKSSAQRRLRDGRTGRDRQSLAADY